MYLNIFTVVFSGMMFLGEFVKFLFVYVQNLLSKASNWKFAS